LTQEDINTLLLKSQYNHINHLDDKLNEVTASVVGLERKFDGKFSDMENRFVGLENRFEGLENKFELLNEKIEHTIQKSLNKNMIMLASIRFIDCKCSIEQVRGNRIIMIRIKRNFSF
jgi:predicted nuclease with TOPRIM domain